MIAKGDDSFWWIKAYRPVPLHGSFSVPTTLQYRFGWITDGQKIVRFCKRVYDAVGLRGFCNLASGNLDFCKMTGQGIPIAIEWTRPVRNAALFAGDVPPLTDRDFRRIRFKVWCGRQSMFRKHEWARHRRANTEADSLEQREQFLSECHGHDMDVARVRRHYAGMGKHYKKTVCMGG